MTKNVRGLFDCGTSIGHVGRERAVLFALLMITFCFLVIPLASTAECVPGNCGTCDNPTCYPWQVCVSTEQACYIHTDTCYSNTFVHECCTPDCSCAQDTCVGSTCTDTSCGSVCAGTKQPQWSEWSYCGCTATCGAGCTGTQTRTDVSGCKPPETRSCTLPAISCGFYACYQDQCCALGAGSSCQSAPNSCGQRSTGTKQCDGRCSAITPPDSDCACTGPPPACGTKCGVKSCVSGVWTDTCVNERSCTPGSTRSCISNGITGTQTCLDTCDWGVCFVSTALMCGGVACGDNELCCNNVCRAPTCTVGSCGAGYVCSDAGTCGAKCAPYASVLCGGELCTPDEVCCNDECKSPACTSSGGCAEGLNCQNPDTCNAQCVAVAPSCDWGTFSRGSLCCNEGMQRCVYNTVIQDYYCQNLECSPSSCGNYPDCYNPAWTCDEWTCTNPALYPGRQSRTCVDQYGDSTCTLNKPATVRQIVETPNLRNCVDDNCNLKKDEPNALPCCDPGTLGPSDMYACGQSYPVVKGRTPPPGKTCASDAAWSTCIEGTCEQFPTQCSLRTTLCAGKNSCGISKDTYPYSTINSCKMNATLEYRINRQNEGWVTMTQSVVVDKLRGATCDLGCAQQTGCFGTYTYTHKKFGEITETCDGVPQNDCGTGTYRTCTKNPIVCSQPDAGRCANDGGPCTDTTAYASDGGVCAYGESCNSVDCTAAGYNIVCPVPPPADCDIDDDGYNGTYQGCAFPIDCNDDPALEGAAVHPPNTYETGTVRCSNNIDDDCDSALDYEGPSHNGISKDASCAVSVISASVNPPVCDPTSVMVNCTYDTPGNLLTSQRAHIIRGGVTVAPCEWRSWDNQVAIFECPTAGLPRGEYNATCSIDPAVGTMTGIAKDNPFSITPCGVRWEGYLIDVVTQQPITLVRDAYISVDGIKTPLSEASFNIGNIVPGNRVISADAEGYDPIVETVFFTDDPTKHNITLSPAVCQPDCSLDMYCDYSCLDEGACSMYGGLSPAEIANIRALCSKTTSGYILYNGSMYIRCCAAGDDDPRISPEKYAVAFSLESTSKAVVPHTRLVTLYGRVHSLVVLSFARRSNE